MGASLLAVAKSIYYCLQVAITAPERGPITHPAQEG